MRNWRRKYLKETFCFLSSYNYSQQEDVCFDNLTTLYVGIPSGQDEMNLAAYFVSRQLPSVTMGYSIYRR